MEIFEGRRAATGQWVAYGEPALVFRCVESQELVEHVQPSGGIRHVKLAYQGRPFSYAGDRYVYGYPAEDK